MPVDHTGVCRPAKRFRTTGLAQIAAAIEAEFGDSFRQYGARLRVRPIRISHFFSVGEGVALDLDPDDVEKWEWWGHFESDVEVSRRARLTRIWNDRLGEDDVEAWLRKEAKDYLSELNELEANLGAPSEGQDARGHS